MGAFAAALAAALLKAAAVAGAIPPGEQEAISEAPVVGIFPTLERWVKPEDRQAYYGAYQKWLEQFGAKTVMLMREGNAEWEFEKINALLIPGGPTVPAAPLAKELIKLAIQASQRGDYFPVWGTCLGYEWIVETVGGLDAIEIGKFDAVDLPGNLTFTEAAPGRMFGAANSTMLGWMASEGVIYEDHEDGIEPQRFAANPQLAGFFDVLATAGDRAGKRYVGAIEGKSLPIYGIQFHPEKVRFVNNTATVHVPKTAEAVATADMLASFFVAEARKNKRRVPDPTDKMGQAGYYMALSMICRNKYVKGLCDCEELEQEGYVDAVTCLQHSPQPALDFCAERGRCRHPRRPRAIELEIVVA